jgi:outer membrane protein TolC
MHRIENQLVKIRNLMKAEQAIAFDTLELANKKLQIFTQLSALQGTESILESQLKFLINEPELEPVQLPEELPVDLNLDDINVYYQLATEHRPELNQINARIKSTGYFASTLEGAFYPMINASGSYNRARFDGFIFDGSWIDFYNVMLTFQWELWNWNRDKRKVQQTQLESERLDLASRELLNTIRQQVKTAYQILKITMKQVYLQQQLAEQEAERFRQTRERFQQELTTILDLNSAENDLTSAQLELEKSKILWHKYKLQLDHATGLIGIKN